MAKILSKREMELFRAAVILAIQLDRCNPEVGMGPSRQMLAEKVAAMLSFEIDPEDIGDVCSDIQDGDMG